MSTTIVKCDTDQCEMKCISFELYIYLEIICITIYGAIFVNFSCIFLH